MGYQSRENITEEELINQIHQFVNCHLEYNKSRTRTSTEKELLAHRDRFVGQHPSISLERSEEINPRTFCAHGTNAWALFSACAFSNGQLLSRNALKLAGMVPISGESKGLSIENRNFISTVELVSRSANLDGTTKYSTASTGAYLQKNPYEYLKNKYLKKYEKRNTSRSLKDDFQSIFEHPSMQAACDRLSKIPIVVVGDGIGDSGFTFALFSFISAGAGREPGEILYKRLNIRAVILNETDKAFVQKLIQIINPELEKTIAFLTTEEVKKFEAIRQSQDKAHRRLYIIDFLDAFNEIKATLKVAFSAMRPVRIDEDVVGKRYPVRWGNDPDTPPVIRFEAGETVYYEKMMEKTSAQGMEDICNEALQASIEVIKVVSKLAKNAKYSCEVDSVEAHFTEHRRFWNRELDLYQSLYGASDSVIAKIEEVRSAFRIAKEEIKFAKASIYIRKEIRKYREQCLNKENSSSTQVISLKIMDLLESVIGEIIFINDRKVIHYEESIKENKALKLAGEWVFIRDLIRRYKEYSQKCLNSLDSWHQDMYQRMYLDRNDSEVGCHGEPLRKDLGELIKNIHYETSQYCNRVITLLQDLTKRDAYSIENYHIEVNSISIGFGNFYRMLNVNVFDSNLFKNHLPLHLVDSVTDIKSILTTTRQERDNTLEIVFHHRDLAKEKALISEMRGRHKKLNVSKIDSNTAKNKANCLLKIINLCEELEKNNLSTDRISEIRTAIERGSETLRIHRHTCILTPFLKVLCFFKPMILEKKVDSIKVTANLDSYLNSLEKSLKSNIKP